MAFLDSLRRADAQMTALSDSRDMDTGKVLPQGSVARKDELRNLFFTMHRYLGFLIEDAEGGKTARIGDLEALTQRRDMIVRLAQGVDPTVGEVLPPNEVLTQPRYRLCFDFVAKALDRAIAGRRYYSARVPFSLPAERRGEVELSQEPILLTAFLEKLNATRKDTTLMRGVSVVKVSNWLTRAGLLEQREGVRLPTQAGRRIGIGEMVSTWEDGNVRRRAATYNAKAQKYLLDHLDEIMR